MAGQRLVEAVGQLDGMDDEAGTDLVGVKARIEMACQRLALLDQRLDRGRPPHRLTTQAARMLLPASAVEELSDARRVLKVLVRALQSMPAGCEQATALLNAGISQQLLRVMRAKNELDRHLG
jgi:hypothetical protein